MVSGIWSPGQKTVVEEFQARVQEAPQALAVRFLLADGPERTWTRDQLWHAAGACAARLEEAGLRQGEVCALLLPYRADLAAWYWGCARLGAIPSILAYPSTRLHPDKFREGLRGMAVHSGLDLLVTDPALESRVAPLVAGGSVRGLLPVQEGDFGSAAWPGERWVRPDRTTPFLLQHSSGTTGLQKAVVLSNQAILEQLADLSVALELRPERDAIVSWLPLYHDMGLIAAWLLPFLSGTSQTQLSPFDWVARPALLLEALARYRGTLSWLPNFAFKLLADRLADEELNGLTLGHVRCLVNCSEPVRGSTFDRFLERLGPAGLRPGALSASYALAENVFAVTQTAPGLAPTRLWVDGEALQTEGRVLLPPAGCRERGPDGSGDRPGALRECVSSGRPLRASRACILDEQGNDLGAGRVGEVAIRSPYLFDGYRRGGRTSREVAENGWFKTGDLGFLYQGELYVVGRKKDLLIVRGRNLYPQDIEESAGGVEGVYPGRVVAYGEYVEALGTEAVVVLAETAYLQIDDRRRLASRIRERVQRDLEVQVYRVDFVPPRWLVKSSSGKLARQTNVERWRATFLAKRPALAGADAATVAQLGA